MKTEKIEISHPDKILFPQAELTKADIASYYKRIADYMLPHIKDRPLTLRHYPHGIDESGFFHKHAPDHFPEFVERLDVSMKSKGGENMKMASADEAADLVYFAGQNVIELHMGLARKYDLEIPDQIIFDLDPSDNDFEKVRKTAFALKDILDERDLPSFLKTTGSRGVHIHIPIKPEKKFDEVKKAVRKLAETLHDTCPDLTTLESRKKKRGDKVFIDYLRNDYGMTAIAPYSLRALKGAPIATPIDWEELKDRELGPQSYTLENIFRRLPQKADPWKKFYSQAVKLGNFTI